VQNRNATHRKARAVTPMQFINLALWNQINYVTNTIIMNKYAVFIILVFLSGGLRATICDESDNAMCNMYDLSNIKVAHANFVESKLRKSYPQFFSAAGKKIQIKYVEQDKVGDSSNHYAGHVNLKEMIDAYASKSPYIVHLVPEQNENLFRTIVSHEIGHLLNFVCVASRLENDYKHASESFKKMIMNGTFRFSYFSDVSKVHDDRYVEQLADSFKDYVMDGKPIPKEFLREFCIEE
jgi:hypothetical protein